MDLNAEIQRRGRLGGCGGYGKRLPIQQWFNFHSITYLLTLTLNRRVRSKTAFVLAGTFPAKVDHNSE